MGDNKDIREKIKGHRKAIAQHIKKYNSYPHQQDKDFALKTIKRVQAIIAELKKEVPGIEKKEEDSWAPSGKSHY
jgi:hypothetical protein